MTADLPLWRRHALPLAALLLLALVCQLASVAAPGSWDGKLAYHLGHKGMVLFVVASMALILLPPRWLGMQTAIEGKAVGFWWLLDALLLDLVVVDGLAQVPQFAPQNKFSGRRTAELHFLRA